MAGGAVWLRPHPIGIIAGHGEHVPGVVVDVHFMAVGSRLFDPSAGDADGPQLIVPAGKDQ